MDFSVIIWLKSIASTMDYVKNNASVLPVNHSLVVAELQTNGRGQRGATFLSEKGGLYISMPLKPKNLSSDWQNKLIVTLSEHTQKWLEHNFNVQATIKPPNDLLIGSRKIMGVLVEAVYLGNQLESLVLGAGFNLNQKFNNRNLDFKAVSLAEVTGKSYNPWQILPDWLNGYEPFYSDL